MQFSNSLIAIYGVLITALCVMPSKATPDITKTKITTNIQSIKDQRTEGNGLANIIDNDDKTFFWTGNQLRENNIVRFTFDKPIPLGNRLKIYTGLAQTNNEDGDMLQYAVLEASPDQGKSWKTIDTFQTGNAEAKITFLTAHYRIRATRNDARWGAIRHLTITDQLLTRKTVKGSATLKGKRYPLTVTTDLDGFPGSDDPKLAKSFEAMAKLYFQVWPKLMTWLDAEPTKIPRDINISFVSTLTHPAHASGHTMTMLTKHLINHPHDIEGVFVHELAHIVQAYSSYNPTWFVEGSADYVRYRQFPDRAWANSARARMNNEQPLSLYWNSACFLLWMEETYKKPITATISKAIFEKKYNDTLFKMLTGKTINDLVTEYKKSEYRPKLNSPLQTK